MSDLVPKRRRRAKRRIYELGEFKMIGFSMANALAGEESVPVLTRAALLSDDPFFHHCLRAFAQEVDARLREREIAANLSQASNFAIVVEPDVTARLYLDCVDYSLEMVAKRAVEKGEAVWSSDIGDIYRGNLRHPKLRPNQHYVLCLRHDWKFLLVFDLTPEQLTDPAALEVTIGLGMRRLLFEQLYETMADENVLATMIARGWFPFNELIGAEFDDLRRAIANNFNLEAVEETLVSQFTRERCDLLLGRWWRSPLYDSRRALLTEGVSLFAEGRYISSIKTLLTEIEGILRERHVPRTSGRQGMDKVLSVAFEEVLDFAGSDTIYFPEQFVRYLKESVFAHFDPTQPATEANRNTVGHGLARGDAYTAVRALQTVLVLDQINRYVALPTRPAKRRRSR